MSGADACAIVGDTPITDVLGDWPLKGLAALVTKSEALGLPIFFLGVGTESLAMEWSQAVVAETLAPRVAEWSVRTEQDRRRLSELGVGQATITVASDLAWLLGASTTDFGREIMARAGIRSDQPVLGINVQPDRRVMQQEPGFLTKLGQVLERLVGDGYQILIISNEVRRTEDYEAGKALKATMANAQGVRQLPNMYFSPQQMLSLIGCCDVVLGMRYHFVLMAAVQEVPFVAITREGKLKDLCADMRWDGTVSAVGSKTDDFVEALHRVQGRRERDLLQRQVVEMRRRASFNGIVLARVLADSGLT